MSFTAHIINKMTTLVVFLLYIQLSLSHSQNLGLTESDYEEEKATNELSDGPHLIQNNGFIQLFLNHFLKSN